MKTKPVRLIPTPEKPMEGSSLTQAIRRWVKNRQEKQRINQLAADYKKALLTRSDAKTADEAKRRSEQRRKMDFSHQRSREVLEAIDRDIAERNYKPDMVAAVVQHMFANEAVADERIEASTLRAIQQVASTFPGSYLTQRSIGEKEDPDAPLVERGSERVVESTKLRISESPEMRADVTKTNGLPVEKKEAKPVRRVPGAPATVDGRPIYPDEPPFDAANPLRARFYRRDYDGADSYVQWVVNHEHDSASLTAYLKWAAKMDKDNVQHQIETILQRFRHDVLMKLQQEFPQVAIAYEGELDVSSSEARDLLELRAKVEEYAQHIEPEEFFGILKKVQHKPSKISQALSNTINVFTK